MLRSWKTLLNTEKSSLEQNHTRQLYSYTVSSRESNLDFMQRYLDNSLRLSNWEWISFPYKRFLVENKQITRHTTSPEVYLSWSTFRWTKFFGVYTLTYDACLRTDLHFHHLRPCVGRGRRMRSRKKREGNNISSRVSGEHEMFTVSVRKICIFSAHFRFVMQVDSARLEYALQVWKTYPMHISELHWTCHRFAVDSLGMETIKRFKDTSFTGASLRCLD